MNSLTSERTDSTIENNAKQTHDTAANSTTKRKEIGKAKVAETTRLDFSHFDVLASNLISGLVLSDATKTQLSGRPEVQKDEIVDIRRKSPVEDAGSMLESFINNCCVSGERKASKYGSKLEVSVYCDLPERIDADIDTVPEDELLSSLPYRDSLLICKYKSSGKSNDAPHQCKSAKTLQSTSDNRDSPAQHPATCDNISPGTSATMIQSSGSGSEQQELKPPEQSDVITSPLSCPIPETPSLPSSSHMPPSTVLSDEKLRASKDFKTAAKAKMIGKVTLKSPASKMDLEEKNARWQLYDLTPKNTPKAAKTYLSYKRSATSILRIRKSVDTSNDNKSTADATGLPLNNDALVVQSK